MANLSLSTMDEDGGFDPTQSTQVELALDVRIPNHKTVPSASLCVCVWVGVWGVPQCALYVLHLCVHVMRSN